MPGSTSGGYPYAVPADPLVQWPSTSQSLAEKIDQKMGALPKIASGESQSSSSSAVVVNLPPGLFTATPSIVITPVVAGEDNPAIPVVWTKSRDAFGVVIYTPAGQKMVRPFNWIAVQTA